MNGFGMSMGQMPTLEQHNYQVAMQKLANRRPAGVLCPCGSEMVYVDMHEAYNISYGNPNHLSPGRSVNVQCPNCRKTGWKE